MKRIAVATVCALAALCSPAFGLYTWAWQQQHDVVSAYYDLRLTMNSGSHALAIAQYQDDNDAWHTWTTSAARYRHPVRDYIELWAYEYRDWVERSEHWPLNLTSTYEPYNGCAAANNAYKLWVWADSNRSQFTNKCRAKTGGLTGWEEFHVEDLTQEIGHGCDSGSFTAVCFGGTSPYMCAAYVDESKERYGGVDHYSWGLHAAITDNGGNSWTRNIRIVPDAEVPYNAQDGPKHPSLAVNNDNGTDVYVAYQYDGFGIVFEKSTDHGSSWLNTPTVLSSSGARPCIAAIGLFVFACWHTTANQVAYRISTDGGSNWSTSHSIPGFNSAASWSHTNVSAVSCENRPAVLLVTQRSYAGRSSIEFCKFGRYVPEAGPEPLHMAWQSNLVLSPYYEGSQELAPSVATVNFEWQANPGGKNVHNVPTTPWGLDFRPGHCVNRENRNVYPTGMGTGRLIAGEADGTVQYAAVNWPHVVSGPIDDEPIPILVGPGDQPALALDGDGNRWISYISLDTVWTMTGDGSYKVAFAGSSSAVPGQPSIVCYSEQATSGYCASVVFPVYDTAGGASKIMFARVDTSAVVLDTIESVANLRDSLPCISIYKTDTLLATFQHGDSILSVLLADYGPGSTGRPSAWSSPNLVTASGYHAMSTFEQGGSVLNCVWSGKSGNNYAIHRATIDLSGGMFPSWTAQSDPSSNAATEVSSAVYAGLGVTCWQAKVNGKWVIKGKVRGEEETFVANDTDAYHPHAVAESSAISPSIDQVRVHLLWTEGVTFEVDSGVYDTGETRYKCESLSVSRAGSDATKSNTGAKLLRKASGDSLFCVYSDLDGTVMYARSAAGDSWHRDVMVTSRDWPAIAEDSSGKRWVVVHKVNVGGTQTQEAYYRNGSSWTGPQTIYTSQPNGTVGPAGLSGSSYTTSAIAYAAFLLTPSIGPKSIVLAKFNGSTVATYTVASGTSLADPSLAVEPYKQDSDHVHVSWVDNGVVKYCMDTDGRSSSIASKWTSTVTLSNAMVTATHPCIAADRNQIVAAWAQGATTEIYSRKRSTGSAYNNWQSEVNLSNTSTASDYPTIAMGDTVIVAWEEHRTVSDFDVLASINFGDTINIADNATKSGYPHVLFQNKTSGDTAIPYLHVIWSETPEANVYEVAYNRHNLKQSGEGQQSAGQTPLPRKPMLAACRPNPFRDKTTIAYQLPQAGNVSLCVYDVTGRTVRTLQRGFQKPGEYSVNWDSKDSRGRQVPRGVYFYRLDTPGFRDVKKAVVAR